VEILIKVFAIPIICRTTAAGQLIGLVQPLRGLRVTPVKQTYTTPRVPWGGADATVEAGGEACIRRVAGQRSSSTPVKECEYLVSSQFPYYEAK